MIKTCFTSHCFSLITKTWYETVELFIFLPLVGQWWSPCYNAHISLFWRGRSVRVTPVGCMVAPFHIPCWDMSLLGRHILQCGSVWREKREVWWQYSSMLSFHILIFPSPFHPIRTFIPSLPPSLSSPPSSSVVLSRDSQYYGFHISLTPPWHLAALLCRNRTVCECVQEYNHAILENIWNEL